ncbi:hypothetical protein [Tenggerimyces flavus]|uniref:DUF1273 domain-containing protein n=1 Tax=Tenggerimyces flavus TaxID=1708749 RepID=A0ABV7YSC6_9ACTN|nr:hypothetical protein [Tenggerimyces flavus]MBM7790140.1 hypothetical protein [Tenggerimyces flavus]
MRIAISGHRGLRRDVEQYVNNAIRSYFVQLTPAHLVGISCLADGADQIFARAVIDAGGHLNVIVPAAQYRDALPEDSRATYDELLANAAEVVTLDHQESTSESHMDASRAMLERADQLIAVWDGEPARGYGATADVVHLAQDLGLPVTIIWPADVTR